MADGKRRQRHETEDGRVADGGRPLAGFAAIELGGLGAQMCGKVLSDLGVEVIKIEEPGGDPTRQLEPIVRGQSLKFTFLNSGKKSVMLDSTPAENGEVLGSLLADVDFFVVGLTNRSLAAWGLDLDQLHQELPELIVVSVTGFGRAGPYSTLLEGDLIEMAMGGLMYVSGDPSDPPVTAPESQASYFAGIFAAQGATLGLARRERDPARRGALVDVTSHQALASIEQLIRIYGRQGRVPGRTGSQHKHVAPARVYPTADGYVSLFVTNQHWATFLDTWPDHPSELNDPALGATQERMAQLDMIDRHVRSYISDYSTEEFVTRMAAAGVPCTPVNSLGEFLSDSQTTARQLLQTVHQPELGEVSQVAFPPLFNGRRQGPASAPLLGQHTQEVLARLRVRTSGTIEAIEE